MRHFCIVGMYNQSSTATITFSSAEDNPRGDTALPGQSLKETISNNINSLLANQDPYDVDEEEPRKLPEGNHRLGILCSNTLCIQRQRQRRDLNQKLKTHLLSSTLCGIS